MKSLFKALDIIETLAEAGEMGIRELSSKTGIPPATIHRIVSALMDRQYLQKTHGSKRYALSPKYILLADSIRGRSVLSLIARPYLEELMRQSGENANLCVRDGLQATYIDHVQSRKHNLRIFTRIGASAPLYATGVGKIFLAGMPGDRLETYFETVKLQPLTPHTITDLENLRAEIRKIRNSGYSVDNEEKELGVRCIAAPLLNLRGETDAAISISGPAQRITTRRLPALSAAVKAIAADISVKRGYAPPNKTI